MAQFIHTPLIRVAFTLLLSLFDCLSWAQSKNEIKQYNILAATETITEFVDGQEITRKDSYKKYDKQGNVIGEISFDKRGKEKEHVERKFNRFGDKIEETTYDAIGQLVWREVYKYDDLGEKSEESKYDSKNVLVSRSVFKIDRRGLKTEKETYDIKGNLIQTKKYIYDN